MKTLLKDQLSNKSGGFGEFKEENFSEMNAETRAEIGRTLMQTVFH